MLKVLSAAGALFLAGCVVVPVPAEKPTCQSNGLAAFTGREANPATGEEILRVSRAHVLRWVPPGAAVTMEFRADRATIHVDANKRIESVTCG